MVGPEVLESGKMSFHHPTLVELIPYGVLTPAKYAILFPPPTQWHTEQCPVIFSNVWDVQNWNRNFSSVPPAPIRFAVGALSSCVHSLLVLYKMSNLPSVIFGDTF